MRLPKWFEVLPFPEACIQKRSSAEEGKRRFVISPRKGDEVWRIKVDSCWQIGVEGKRVDYLFWGKSVAGRKVVILVELKGKDFAKALEQVESTLQQLCKNSDGQGIHHGDYKKAPGHEIHNQGGVQAYVVLSKGSGVAQSIAALKRIRERYGVRVVSRGQVFTADGVDSFFD